MVRDDKVKKLKGVLVLVLLLALLASPVAVLASDITGAKYYGLIQVSNNGTAVTNVATTCNISTTNLINGGYLNSSANNCAIQSSAGADLAFQPSVDIAYPWGLWVPSMAADGIKTDILYTANTTGGKIRYFPGAGGMTTPDDDADMELGGNFTIEQKGWVDTSFNNSTKNAKLLVDKTGAINTAVSGTGNITSLIAGDAWVEVAGQLDGETAIYDMVVLNGKLYGATGNLKGRLYEWNGTNAWVKVASQLDGETHIRPLAVFNGKIYGGTHDDGRLYEWNGVDLWVQVAPKLGAETSIHSLAVYNGKLYGGTGDLTGELYEWDGVDEWVSVAGQEGAETRIPSLAVYNGKLYGGTIPNGNLFEWNGVDAWVSVADQLGAETSILSLAVYNGKLYGGTSALTGELYEWDGVDEWVSVAGQEGGETQCPSLVVLNGKLYGGTFNDGRLHEWNGTDAWVMVADKLGAEEAIHSLVVHNGKIYGGTGNLAGKLYEWDSASATLTGVGSGEYTIKTTTDNTTLYLGIGKDVVNADFPTTDDILFNAPLWHTESRGSPFTSKDATEWSCTVAGGAVWSAANGYYFDGADDEITQATLLDGGGDAFTFEIWVKPTGGADAERWLMRKSNIAAEDRLFLTLHTDNTVRWFVEATNNGNRIVYSAAATDLNTWYHIVAVYDKGDALRLYVNLAESIGPQVVNTLRAGVDIDFFISFAGAGTLTGYVGEARVYDRALSATEVETNYDATKWKYETSDEYFHYNLLSANVTDTATDWAFCQNDSIMYLEYQDIEIGGVERQRIVWEYDTIFQDSSDYDNDATPSFRTTSSDPDVSAVLVSFGPIAEAKAPAYVLEEAVPFIETVPVIVSEFDVVPPTGGFPLAGVIAAIAVATDTPPQLPLLLIATFVIIALSLAVSSIMRQYGSGTIFVKIIVIAAVMGVFVGLGNFGVDFWMIFVFLIIGVSLAMGSRQIGWQ